MTIVPHAALDLVLERTVDVPPALVWRAWTEPELLKKWFTPAPWVTSEAEVDLRPGGFFRTVMNGPDGEREVNQGCYLDVVREERLVWTDALLAGYRPAPAPRFTLTAVITLERAGSGTKYTARAMHADKAARDAHEQMGFHDGWGTTLDQLVALAKQL